MEAMVCRAGSSLSSWVASTARVSSSRSARSQCALLAGPHSPQLVVLLQVNAKRNERRRNLIVFAKGDAHKEAVVLEDSAMVESAATQTVPDISQSPRSEFQTASTPSWIAVSFVAALLFSTTF